MNRATLHMLRQWEHHWKQRGLRPEVLVEDNHGYLVLWDGEPESRAALEYVLDNWVLDVGCPMDWVDWVLGKEAE